MIEVLKKVDKYRIQCKKCHSVLGYDDEYDELGMHEFESKVEEERVRRREKGLLLERPILQELYIWCPVCKNKVITARIGNGYYGKIRLGQRI